MGTQIYALWDIFATRKKKVQDVKQCRPCGGVDLDRCLMEYIVPKAATQFEIVKLGIIVPFQIKKLSVQVEVLSSQDTSTRNCMSVVRRRGSGITDGTLGVHSRGYYRSIINLV